MQGQSTCFSLLKHTSTLLHSWFHWWYNAPVAFAAHYHGASTSMLYFIVCLLLFAQPSFLSINKLSYYIVLFMFHSTTVYSFKWLLTSLNVLRCACLCFLWSHTRLIPNIFKFSLHSKSPLACWLSFWPLLDSFLQQHKNTMSCHTILLSVKPEWQPQLHYHF